MNKTWTRRIFSRTSNHLKTVCVMMQIYKENYRKIEIRTTQKNSRNSRENKHHLKFGMMKIDEC